MHPSEYQKLASRTEGDYVERQKRISELTTLRLTHATMGVITEAGELTDAVKKWIFYGKSFDPVNVKEEVGDVLWYLALVCNAMNVTLDDCMEANIAKLCKRFPDKYTDDYANHRDLAAEYKALEQEHDT